MSIPDNTHEGFNKTHQFSSCLTLKDNRRQGQERLIWANHAVSKPTQRFARAGPRVVHEYQPPHTAAGRPCLQFY